MNILAIDTSTALLGIGLKTGESYYEINQDVGLHHTENLLTEIDTLLHKARLEYRNIDLLVVSKGPGSFTGLRIGMAAAKGISFGTGAPLISVPSLDICARGKAYFDGTVCPVIDARKQRVYTALYRGGRRESDYLDISPRELLQKCIQKGQVLLTGSFAADLLDMWGVTDDSVLLDPQYGRPLTWELLKYGTELYAEQGPDSPDEGPLYIRPSEAEMSLKNKKDLEGK